MTVNTERVRLLVDALRSGQYVQGTNCLEQREAAGEPLKHCCLGVACRVAMANGLDVSAGPVHSSFGVTAFDGEMYVLPKSVAEWYGFVDEKSAYEWNGVPRVYLTPDEQALYAVPNPIDVVSLNDTIHMDFEDIAKAFERTYLTD